MNKKASKNQKAQKRIRNSAMPTSRKPAEVSDVVSIVSKEFGTPI